MDFLVCVGKTSSTLWIGIIGYAWGFFYFRWIVYTIQARKFHAKAEWSFTKIEEQQKLKENDVTEEEAIELQETPSPQHYESLAIPENKGILFAILYRFSYGHSLTYVY